MWFVQLALRFPYTFTIETLLIIILRLFAALRMEKDLFPGIDLSLLRALATTINGSEPIGSRWLDGIAAIEVLHKRAPVLT
ncbi:MAG TPA: hypothetical protein VKC60_06285 [Opitutaceae bacterium]|nr:hypothetical protein [Opitutaceae bacterium]